MANTASERVTAVLSRPVLSVLATIALIGLLMTVGSAAGGDRLPDSVGHALSHLFVGAPLGLLLVAVLRWWPPAREIAPGRLGRRIAVIGMTGVVTGQLFEIVGARVDEPAATPLEGVAHTVGMVVTTLSMLILGIGSVLALVAATRDRAVPRWLAAIIAVLVLGALTMMFVGAPGA